MAVQLELHTGDEDDLYPEGSVQKEYYQKSNETEDEEAVQMDDLAAHISEQWTTNKQDRTRIEQEMMRLQEAVNGDYDPNTMSAIKANGGSEIFIPLTSMQCNAGASWLLSVLAPPGDKAWSFKATPIPELPESVKMEIKKNIKQTLSQNAPKVMEGAQQGLPAGPGGEALRPKDVNKIAGVEAEQMLKKYRQESNVRAERMENLVHDQLLDSDWYDTLEDFITDFVTFPTAFIKTTYDYQTKMVTAVQDGKFTMLAEKELIAKDERVSPFDMYPSPDQKTVNDGSMIERLRLSRTEVYNCLDKPGYSNENILKVLEEVGSSNFTAWQSNVDSQRRYSENHSTDFSGQDGSIYGLRFLGSVSVAKLISWGYPVESLRVDGFISDIDEETGKCSDRDKLREIDIDAILIGNHVIKAVPNLDPEGKRPYYAASYRRVPGSFWGKSVAMLSQPHQRLVNATARALSNNMGISSGPQVVVYTDRLPNGESIQSIRPLKVWQMISDKTGSNSKPIEFFQPQSNAKELMAVYQYYMDSVGDVTGIPKQSYSSDPSRMQQGAQTASGMAMLLETASKQIKKAVMNIDTGIIEPRLQYQYRTNMINPEVDSRYKGDMRIEAVGAKSIVAKAVQNQRNMEILQATANPMDMEVLGQEGRAALLREILRNYDMEGVAPTEEEMASRAMEQQQQPKPPSAEETKLQIEQIRAEVRIKDQELENQNAEAQRQLDLQIAELEFKAKQMDLEIATVQNKQDNDAKLQQIALRETNNNARFKAEAAIKKTTGTGM